MTVYDDKYHRPVTKRYNPSEWEKSAARIPWMDCDPVARCAIEDQYGGVPAPVVDHHGYPTA